MQIYFQILCYDRKLAFAECLVSLTYWVLVFSSLQLLPASVYTKLFITEFCLSDSSNTKLHFLEIHVSNVVNVGCGKSLVLQVSLILD